MKTVMGTTPYQTVETSSASGIGQSIVDRIASWWNGSSDDYGMQDYLEGLLSSVGAENEANRDYNAKQAALNREFQAIEAAKERQWYTDLSNSAYTRSVADMKRAGINPILAYQQGGASAAATGIPAGSAASYQTGGGDTASSVIQSVAALVSAIAGSSSSRSSNSYREWLKKFSESKKD